MPACCSYRKSSCERMDDLSISSAAFQSQNDNSLFTLIVPIFTWEILDTPLAALDLWRGFVGQTEARSNRRFRGPNETIGLLRMILVSFMSINLAYRLATDGSDRPRISPIQTRLQRNRVTQFRNYQHSVFLPRNLGWPMHRYHSFDLTTTSLASSPPLSIPLQ
jgi:hypothetical protein